MMLSNLPPEVIHILYSTSTYKGLQISADRRFASDWETLRRYQEAAIDAGSVYDVTEPTSIFIFGISEEHPRIACIQVSLPPSPQGILGKLQCVSVCLIRRADLVVAGVVLVPLTASLRHFALATNIIDLESLTHDFRPFLDRHGLAPAQQLASKVGSRMGGQV
jgi:hypothetical protein